MTFKRFVEVGRVALICYGPDAGKLCTIVNILDHNRVLVDGPMPLTGVHRQEIGIKRIMLTDLKVAIKLNATQKSLMKQWEEEGTLAKWESTSWAKKLRARKLRSETTDFDRFQVMLARKERSAARKAACA
mmetsp:Transcript_16949/g.36726  ORF Transcript_16949/g.36726 Transcript_16949/m.36726 type:complete len:131 (-) Transcript_16949:233-625(-)